MSERNGFEPGVPCWVDTWRTDANRAADFYAGIFGWETLGRKAAGLEQYVMCRVRGRDVAAIGSPLPSAVPPSPPVWTTYIWVDDADESAGKARKAGGSVLAEPFDSLDGGRMAILADPGGATFGIWKPGRHRGAQLVNEPGAWSMSLLQTPDVERAKQFYGALFGWSTESFGPAVMFRLSGYVGGEPEQPVPRDVVATMIPLAEGSPAGLAARWDVDFWVADVNVVAARTAELGGRVLAPPAPVPGLPMKEATIADPEGAEITVTELTAR